MKEQKKIAENQVHKSSEACIVCHERFENEI